MATVLLQGPLSIPENVNTDYSSTTLSLFSHAALFVFRFPGGHVTYHPRKFCCAWPQDRYNFLLTILAGVALTSGCTSQCYLVCDNLKSSLMNNVLIEG